MSQIYIGGDEPNVGEAHRPAENEARHGKEEARFLLAKLRKLGLLIAWVPNPNPD